MQPLCWPTPILSSSDAYSGFNQFIPDQREWGASYEHSWWNQDDVEHLSVSAMTTPRDFEAPQSSEEEALILEATLQASAHDADTMETSNIKAAEDASLADAIEEQEISKAVEQSLKEKRVVAPKDVVIPNNLPRIFKREVDEYDTDTIGYLLGNLNSDRRYVVTELYIPPRSEEWNSYEVRNADSLDYPKTNGLTVLGWIRRSVRKEYSWSYIDLHRQYEFQKTESSFLGIVVCQHHEKSNIFSLTEKGLKSCKDCRQPLDAVHRHSGDRHLYRHAGHYSFDGHLKTKVVDHRDKSMKLPYEVERMERDEDVDGSVSVKQRKHKSKAKSKVVDALLDAKAFEGLVLDVVKKIPGRKLFQHEKKKATRPSLQDMQKRLVVELAESPSLNTVETPIESGLLQTEKKKPSKKKTVSFTELDIRSPTVVKDEGPVADHPDVLNPLIIPENLIEDFSNYRRVKHNTAKNVETGAFLLGRLDSTGNFVVTSLYFPPQSGSANTFSVHDNDDSYFKYVIDNDLKELGWIHTHPTQDCFLSSIDLHTQYAFQKDRSWFIGIVVAPSINQNRIFSLTKSGFQILKACKESSDKFHQHREDDFLYELANHCVHGKSQNIVIIDRMSSE